MTNSKPAKIIDLAEARERRSKRLLRDRSEEIDIALDLEMDLSDNPYPTDEVTGIGVRYKHTDERVTSGGGSIMIGLSETKDLRMEVQDAVDLATSLLSHATKANDADPFVAFAVKVKEVESGWVAIATLPATVLTAKGTSFEDALKNLFTGRGILVKNP
jgi:hypothetical protein